MHNPASVCARSRRRPNAPSPAAAPVRRAVRIAVVGGPDRLIAPLAALAKAHRHPFEHHNGHTAGRGLETLDAMVRRADLVIIVTGVNSHGAVLHSRAAVRRHGVASVICKSFGPSRLARLIEAIGLRDARALADLEDLADSGCRAAVRG
jgi:hypothetical protein